MAAVASVALPRASCRRLARGGEHRAPLAPRFSRTRLVYRIFRVSAAEATTLQGGQFTVARFVTYFLPLSAAPPSDVPRECVLEQRPAAEAELHFGRALH